MTVEQFKDCLENNLEVLIKEGKPEPEELKKAWEAVWMQYCKLMDSDDEYNPYLDLYKKIYDRRAKIVIVENCVQYLKMCYDADLIDILKSFALQPDITEEDDGDVLTDKLNKIIARIKKWVFQLKADERELEKMRAEQQNDLTNTFFDDALEKMSDAKGYHIKANEITVLRFCREYNRLKKKVRKQAVKQQYAR